MISTQVVWVFVGLQIIEAASPVIIYFSCEFHIPLQNDQVVCQAGTNDLPTSAGTATIYPQNI